MKKIAVVIAVAVALGGFAACKPSEAPEKIEYIQPLPTSCPKPKKGKKTEPCIRFKTDSETEYLCIFPTKRCEEEAARKDKKK